jgi:hypothetical protein
MQQKSFSLIEERKGVSRDRGSGPQRGTSGTLPRKIGIGILLKAKANNAELVSRELEGR